MENQENEKIPCRVCTKCGQVIEANGVELTHYGYSLMKTNGLGSPTVGWNDPIFTDFFARKEPCLVPDMENKEKWWEEMVAWPESGASHSEVQRIVAEAERKGREAALEELKVYIAELKPDAPEVLTMKSTNEDYWDTAYDRGARATCTYIDAKINELKGV